MKIINEETLEIIGITDSETEPMISQQKYNKFEKQLREALGCEPDEFSQKYHDYKKAEAQFKKIYEPFKKNVLSLCETDAEFPKVIVMGGAKVTYVSPSTRTSVDTKKLKEEYPDIAKKLKKTSNVSATLRLEDYIDYSSSESEG